jgi:hypothetical protein
LDAIITIKLNESKILTRSNEQSVEPLKFGPIFYLAGKNGFDVYFLKVNHQYNNIMGLPFDDYYFVIFEKKTKKCSEKSFLVKRSFSNCYWDDLPGDEKLELVIDDGWRNGTGQYFEKTYYEILNNLSVKELFVLGSSADGSYSSQERIVQKKKRSIVVEEVINNSEIEDSENKTLKEIKINF